MKKSNLISRIAILILTVALLTACSGSGGGNSVFERAMSHVSLPRGCSGWKYLVNDYNGDGKIEAYAFGGKENRQYTQWDYIEVYYIDPIGNVTPVITKSTPLVGDPYNTKSLDQNDFRDSYLTIGKQTYHCSMSAVFTVRVPIRLHSVRIGESRLTAMWMGVLNE